MYSDGLTRKQQNTCIIMMFMWKKITQSKSLFYVTQFVFLGIIIWNISHMNTVQFGKAKIDHMDSGNVNCVMNTPYICYSQSV